MGKIQVLSNRIRSHKDRSRDANCEAVLCAAAKGKEKASFHDLIS